MKFQGRGTTYLSPRDTAGNIGAATIKICTDALSLALNEDTFSHFNKCGAIDVEDFRGTKSQGAEITLTLADIADEEIMAMGMNGRIDAVGTPDTVTGENLPLNIAAGDSYYLGGNTAHQNITGLTFTDSASPSAGNLTEGTDYELNAVTGRVDFIGDNISGFTQPFVAAYGYTDKRAVSFFTNPSQEYALRYDFINKANNNAPGLAELYRVRFSVFDNLDLQPDELSIPTMKGSALADTNKTDTDRLGRFGRILF